MTRIAKRGRKSMFTLKLAERIYFLAKKGMTDAEIAYAIGIDESTLTKWKASKRFASMLETAKMDIDDRVEASLLKRAMGYSYTERTVEENQTGEVDELDVKGNPTGKKLPVFKINRRAVMKEVPPSDVACLFWLKNRRPEKWREKNLQITNNILQFNPDKMLQRIKDAYGEDGAKKLGERLRAAISSTGEGVDTFIDGERAI